MSEPLRKRLLSAGFMLTCLFVLYVSFLSLTKVQDSDAWTHLNFGKLIIENGWVPDKEVFVYPSFDMPLYPSYPFWAFGVLFYAAFLLAGAGGMVVLKAAIIAAAFLIMLRDSLKPHANYPVALILMVAAVIISQYRFVVRPDIFLMVFISFSVFSLNTYLYEGKRYIYILPFMHILWANSHSSIIVMTVPFLAFILGGLAQQRLAPKMPIFSKTPSSKQIKVVLAVFAASFLASLLNPQFIEPYFFAYKIVNAQWNKSQIMELMPPSGAVKALLYVLDSLVILSFALNRKRLSLIHLLLVIPFMALPLTAERFRFLVAIVGMPITARNLSSYIDSKNWNSLFHGKLTFAATGALVIILGVLGLSRVEPFGQRGVEFGLGFNYAEVPDGAVRYMDINGITGRVYNPFTYGQYIIWTGYPGRTVFVDARGYLPPDVLQVFQDARYSPQVMSELQREYGFEAVILDQPKIKPEGMGKHGSVDMSFDQEDWALVYWDDKSYLYLKRGGKYAPIIAKDEFRVVKPLMPFSDFIKGLNDENITAFERELRKTARDTGSSRAYMFLSLLYIAERNYPEAIRAASSVRIDGLKTISYIALGDAYRGLGDLKLSLDSFNQALDRDKIPGVFYRAGVVCSMMGDKKRALRYYEKAVELDSSLSYVYPDLINTYRSLGMNKQADEAARKYESLTLGH